MVKYKYRISYTNKEGKKRSTLATTKKEAEDAKSFRKKLNKKSISFGLKPNYKNLRISKLKCQN